VFTSTGVRYTKGLERASWGHATLFSIAKREKLEFDDCLNS
jgi:hypothetical protein